MRLLYEYLGTVPNKRRRTSCVVAAHLMIPFRTVSLHDLGKREVAPGYVVCS